MGRGIAPRPIVFVHFSSQATLHACAKELPEPSHSTLREEFLPLFISELGDMPATALHGCVGSNLHTPALFTASCGRTFRI